MFTSLSLSKYFRFYRWWNVPLELEGVDFFPQVFFPRASLSLYIRTPRLHIQGGISSSVLSVFFTDKFALSQSDARISVAYKICQWKTLTKRLMKCPPGGDKTKKDHPRPILALHFFYFFLISLKSQLRLLLFFSLGPLPPPPFLFVFLHFIVCFQLCPFPPSLFLLLYSFRFLSFRVHHFVQFFLSFFFIFMRYWSIIHNWFVFIFI